MSSKIVWIRYILSALLSIIGISWHLFLSPHFSLLPFILALPTIFMISTLWGFGPAFLSLVIWAYGLSYYHFEPLYTIRVTDTGEMLHLLLFITTSTAVSWMVDRSRKKELKQSKTDADNSVKNMKLEFENRLKDEFVYTLSHDLKTPLSIAMLCSEMISKKSSDEDRVKELATKVTRSLGRINHMILDLLDSRRISAGNPLNMDMAKFDLPEVFRKIVEDFSTLYGERFRLASPAHLEFNGCERFIQRAIENLVSNAIKYGDGDKPIELGADTQTSHVVIWVRNWGKVLTRDDINKMLMPFSRLNPEDTSKEGWGIGLSLVKAIVEGHRGVMEISSNEEQGTKFQLRLPVNRLAQIPS